MLTLAIDASQLLTVAPPPEAARRGVALFTLLAFSGLMLVLLAGVLAIMGARRRRARTPDATARTPGPRIAQLCVSWSRVLLRYAVEQC